MREWVLENVNWLCPLFITIFFSILNVIVAICNLAVMRRQNEMQNDGFCFQLFERRHEIYEDIQKVLSAVIIEGKVTMKDFRNFGLAIKDVKFLFGEDLFNVCDETQTTLNKLQVVGFKIQSNIESRKSDPNHEALCTQENELFSILLEQKNRISEISVCYISFANYKVCKNKESHR